MILEAGIQSAVFSSVASDLIATRRHGSRARCSSSNLHIEPPHGAVVILFTIGSKKDRKEKDEDFLTVMSFFGYTSMRPFPLKSLSLRCNDSPALVFRLNLRNDTFLRKPQRSSSLVEKWTALRAFPSIPDFASSFFTIFGA